MVILTLLTTIKLIIATIQSITATIQSIITLYVHATLIRPTSCTSGIITIGYLSVVTILILRLGFSL